jgi:ATP-binding cassette subfamily B protein
LLELTAASDPVVDTLGKTRLNLKQSIKFDNVGFRYPARPTQSAVSNLDFEIKKGERIAIVGPSGAGKTTIFQLLQRFYDPQIGSIRIDGIDIRHSDRTALRKLISVVSQDPAIFAASAADNIRIGAPDASTDDVVNAAKAAAAHAFLVALPDGYDTQVGERGVLLSGGQRQRLAIARAILRNAPILLLDEATAALDAQSESRVQKAIETLAAKKTTLVIAHRLATVRKANKIIVLDQGLVTAIGTHDTLVSENGLYARLAKMQFAV